MKIINVVQGSEAWHQHRATHFNASDAPAMLGCSPYTTRAQLVRQIATGISPEVDDATQARFDAGHAAEALARPLAEAIVGEELFPCVGVSDTSPHSASFDGLTLMGDTAFEHKALNDTLRAAMVDGCTGADLPKAYRVQMEQQAFVSGAERVLFMASKWDSDGTLVEERHCWYQPDAELRAEILAGWEQFAADVAAYVPEPMKAEVVAAPVVGFGALSLRVEGRVVASNLDTFRADAEAFIARLPRPAELQTDQDFVDAEAAVKACAEAESRIKAATDAALAQMADVDSLLRAAGTVSEAIRAARLALDKAVKVEKDNRKAEIVQAGARAVRAHFDEINATLGDHRIQPPQSLQLDLAAAIKGKKSLASMKDAVDAAAAAAKIAGSQQAERVRQNIAVLADAAGDFGTLFPDRVQLCATKAPEDLRNLVSARIAEHQQREQARLDAERERIRQEETARIERERAQQTPAAGAPAAQQPLDDAANNAGVATGSRNASPSESVTRGSLPPATAIVARLRLGDINAAIAPLTITADGLATLGFRPVGQERAAKLYAGEDFPRICAALQQVIQQAPERAALKAAA